MENTRAVKIRGITNAVNVPTNIRFGQFTLLPVEIMFTIDTRVRHRLYMFPRHTVRTYVIGNRPRAKGRNHGAKNTVKRDKAVVLEPPQRLVAYFRRRPDLESYLFEFSSAREEFSGRSGSSRGGRADERYPDKALARERQPANWITAFLSVSIPSGLHLRSSSPFVYFYRKINIRR